MAIQESDTSRPAADIRDEIARHGAISFARFMELALYAPGCGYYEQPRPIGRRGDFFTSVSVGPVFGELLAFQFAQWLEDLAPPPARCQIVEAGAHDGQLALDVLRWLGRRRPAIFAGLEYRIIEPSPIRRAWQEQKLGREFPNVTWAADFAAPGSPRVRGVIFSNELLDAMPAHRLCRDAAGQRWLEWRVHWDGHGFVWQKGPLSNEAAAGLPRLPAEVEAVLPDGFVIELSPAAIHWWSRAAASLERGKLLALDYGLDGDEWLHPARAGGTLRACAGHHLSENILARPGHQDITAHVNFSLLRQAGEAAGLRHQGLLRQSKFLTEILQRVLAGAPDSGEWTASRVRQFQTLTHPEHLGHRFRVLLQSR
ncbi:MAG TPA: SAM-dependent methyltransferase [Candidatus Acidoferrum sp.]|nr:SAM-dependent methyltransferase [Candidatus Acidoferrum sp.]